MTQRGNQVRLDAPFLFLKKTFIFDLRVFVITAQHR